MELITKRLRLRLWRDEDLPAFAALNSDPRVMQHMPKLLDHAESDASLKRIKENFAQHGFGSWAVELIGIAGFIGFTGLSVPRFAAHFTPCVEIGWRLAYDYWGFGYATEKWRNQSRALNPARAPNGSTTWHKVRLVSQFLNHPHQWPQIQAPVQDQELLSCGCHRRKRT
jgi:Acetyltransferase (GNAT) domain